MSLDQNLFTLLVTPNKDDPSVVDLVEPDGTIHYRKQRVQSEDGGYHIQLYDFRTESLLADVKAPLGTSKLKSIELSNPTSTVELKYTGTLTFRWALQWETHEFEWKREECYLIRKPDPPVLVAIAKPKELPGKVKTTAIQVLDYNLNRFDIDDRKGLEIVLLASLLTFPDFASSEAATPTRKSSNPATTPVVLTPPPLPSKPDPKSGIDRIAELQAARGEVNEVTVEAEGSVNDYAAYVDNLLRDEAMLIVTVRSDTIDTVPKVLSVVEETKRARHKADIEEPLHQYVLYDTVKPKGPKRINLDETDDKKEKDKKYTPPNSLTIHLSKIPMPELEPKPSALSHAASSVSSKPPPHASSSSHSRYPSEKAPRPASPPTSPSLLHSRPASPPHSGVPGRSFFRNSKDSNHHVHSHQLHPGQPSPSPSQLMNPGIYTAPPPPPPSLPSSRPVSGFFGSLRKR